MDNQIPNAMAANDQPWPLRQYKGLIVAGCAVLALVALLICGLGYYLYARAVQELTTSVSGRTMRQETESTTRAEPENVTDWDVFATRKPYRFFYTWRSPDLETVELFKLRNYAALEEKARLWRTEKTRDGDGAWLLRSFYQAVTSPRQESELAYQMFFERLAEWEKAYPESVTVKTALAGTWINYAWAARGDGWGNTVTPEGWQAMGERLQAAAKYAAEAELLAEKCPETYGLNHAIALGQNWPMDRYLESYRRAVEFEPEYTDYYLSCAYALLPRWKGETDRDWERLAREAADQLGGAKGDELYARIVVHIFGYEMDIFDRQIASWERTRLGLVEMMRRYPDSKWNLNAFCVLACVNQDRETARRLFAQLGDRKYISLWMQEDYFSKARAWANGGTTALPPYPRYGQADDKQ